MAPEDDGPDYDPDEEEAFLEWMPDLLRLYAHEDLLAAGASALCTYMGWPDGTPQAHEMAHAVLSGASAWVAVEVEKAWGPEPRLIEDVELPPLPEEPPQASYPVSLFEEMAASLNPDKEA